MSDNSSDDQRASQQLNLPDGIDQQLGREGQMVIASELRLSEERLDDACVMMAMEVRCVEQMAEQIGTEVGR